MKTTLTILTIFLLVLPGSAYAGGIHVVDDLTKEVTARPGDKIQGTILVANSSDRIGEAKVYQTDYTFTADGKNDYAEPGTVSRSNASWITFSPQQFVVLPKESAYIYYTINVPNDESLSGTYWSMLMVEPLPEGSLESAASEAGKITMGVRTIMRYGVQVVVNVGETGKREIKVVDRQLVANEGKPRLQLDLENTGERWLRPWVRAEIYDGNGTHVGSFGGARTRVYPGCSVRAPIELSSLQTGKYNALIVIDNGDESVWGAQYEIDIK